jgi:hypothetical protein
MKIIQIAVSPGLGDDGDQLYALGDNGTIHTGEWRLPEGADPDDDTVDPVWVWDTNPLPPVPETSK